MKKILVLCALILGACDSEGPLPLDAGDGGGGAIDAGDAGTASDADVRCSACTATQICVQSFNGTCGEFNFECQERAAGCTGVNCQECNRAHCQGAGDAGLLTCETAGCPGENPEALHCYGP